jgi:hypothetical protein
MIKPTVGCVVLFTPARADDKRDQKSQPLAAIVACVHGDRSVNLTVFEQSGRPSPAGYLNVPLLQDDDEPREGGFYCEWMPYQKGQAARTEELERRMGTGG